MEAHEFTVPPTGGSRRSSGLRVLRSRPSLTILGIVGSLRAESYNARLLRAAAALLPGDAALETWNGLSTLPPFNEDREYEHRPEVEALRDALRSAHGLVICTPEYNTTIPGSLKNAMDWASRPPGHSPLKGLPVVVMGASTGRFGAVWAQADLRKVLNHAGADVVAEGLAVSKAPESFDEEGRLSDPEQALALAGLLADFIVTAREAPRRVSPRFTAAGDVPLMSRPVVPESAI